jgi:hypothetical protein
MLGDFEHQAVAVVVGLQRERISGRLPSNETSTTAPITWLMRPTLLVVAGAPVRSRTVGSSICGSLLSKS